MLRFGAAEHDVGADLRDLHLADQRAVGVEAMHAVVGRGPQPAVGVEAHAVEAPGGAVGEFLAAGELAAVADIEHADVLRLAFGASARRVDDVELLLVGREGEPVRPDEVVGDDADRAALCRRRDRRCCRLSCSALWPS